MNAALELPARWYPLRSHAEQDRLVQSPARFKVVAAGRRSGKTERAKRRLIMAALDPPAVSNPTFIAAAPTRDQAKRIFWQDLKALAPRELLVTRPSETDLSLTFVTGATVTVVGLDKPQRVEGIPIDGACIDEIAEVKSESWTQSIRPALSTAGRPGWAWFTGRPKGRGLFYDLYHAAAGGRPGWDAFTWTSATIIDPGEIDQAKADLDPLTFAQEYEARWVTFEGLAYYAWNPQEHYRALSYDPNKPLVFCFDFNVDPGVAAIIQEQDHLHSATGRVPMQTTCVIGEVHIPRNSNTPAVCRKLLQDWAHHQGEVYIYGDPAGGARHTSSDATDWDLVKEILRPVFGERLRWRVARKAPYIRDRVNAVNSRLKATDGTVRFLCDPQKAPNVVRDFEGVTLLEGGSGEVDKKGAEDQGLSHLSEAIGYYIHAKHPVGGTRTAVW